uniref:Uncharacterized protein n=1 Tax=Asparagus officinalis TaxID=4686 RepID=Q2AAA9_ASPOF|nr:hypothetical protein 17.t00002 [Asparagus officinalis]
MAHNDETLRMDEQIPIEVFGGMQMWVTVGFLGKWK